MYPLTKFVEVEMPSVITQLRRRRRNAIGKPPSIAINPAGVGTRFAFAQSIAAS